MFLKKNLTKLTLRALFVGSIGFLSAITPINMIQAMEKPADTICGRCGQVKPTLTISSLAYFALRATRCPECNAIVKENIETGRATPTVTVANTPAPQEAQPAPLNILITEPVDIEKGNKDNESLLSNANAASADSISIDIAKEHCIACAKPLDNGTKPHIYSCNHAIHKECFTNNGKQLKECFTCKTTDKTVKQEKSRWNWFSWGKSPSKPETPQQQLEQLEQTAAHLSKRYDELQCSFQFLNQLLAESNQQQTTKLELAKKELEDRIAAFNENLILAQQKLEDRIINLQANKETEHLKALLAYQQNLALIERGSLLTGGAAALIAHNRNFSATKAALIGLGTAVSSYNLLKLFVSEPKK